MEGITQLYPRGSGAVYTAEHPEAKKVLGRRCHVYLLTLKTFEICYKITLKSLHPQVQEQLLERFNSSQDAQPHVQNAVCLEKIDVALHHPNTKTAFFFSENLYYKVVIRDSFKISEQ